MSDPKVYLVALCTGGLQDVLDKSKKGYDAAHHSSSVYRAPVPEILMPSILEIVQRPDWCGCNHPKKQVVITDLTESEMDEMGLVRP